MFTFNCKTFCSEAWRVSIKWLRDRIYLSKAGMAVLGLVLAQGLVENGVVDVLMSYLTRELKQNYLPKSAAIVNVQAGVDAVFVIIIAHLADACIGRFKMVLLSTAIYIVGLMLFFLSSASIIYVPLQLYPTLFLIAVGYAGRDPVLKSFLADQSKNEQTPGTYDETVHARTTFWWKIAWWIGVLAGAFVVAPQTWKISFWIAASVMGIAYFLFLLGNCFFSYQKFGPSGSPITVIGRVVKAAILKRHLDYPTRPDLYFQNHKKELYISPYHRIMRWLDKAAIDSSDTDGDDSKKKPNLCTVAEVREVKGVLTMLPLWLTLIGYSLVKATGDTFFIEQCSSAKPFPFINVNILLVFKQVMIFVADDILLSKFLIKEPLDEPQMKRGEVGTRTEVGDEADTSREDVGRQWESRGILDLESADPTSFRHYKEQWHIAKQQRTKLLVIGVGLIFSVFCCIISWQVEVHRLNSSWIFLSDQLDVYTKNLSILWLIPQFLLLGIMEGFVEGGLDEFYYEHVDVSMREFGEPFSGVVLSIGNFMSIGLVFILPNWFGETLDNSRLDRYCLLLTYIGIVSLCIYGFVSYKYMHSTTSHSPCEQNQSDARPEVTISQMNDQNRDDVPHNDEEPKEVPYNEDCEA